MKTIKQYGILLGIATAIGVPLVWMLLTVENGHATVKTASAPRANGMARMEFELQGETRASADEDYVLEGPAGVARIVQVRKEGDTDTAVIQAGVVPGRSRLAVQGPRGSRVVAEVEIAGDWGDGNENGFPDSLELSNPADARAFLDWFRFLAEEQFYRGDDLDPEINDCAALLRFAYREALRRHDGEWAVRVGLQTVKPIPDVSRYNYPFTPLRADLFRLKPGSFQLDDLNSGTFGQFADAETLLLYNATPIGKDIRRARPGDLLFFRQDRQSMPFHAMLYLGPSTLEPGPGAEADRMAGAGTEETEAQGENGDGPAGRGQEQSTGYVLYHTGPDGSWKGEMRRPSLAELFHHPEPRWHPSAANPMFLGVYRWKILGKPSMN